MCKNPPPHEPPPDPFEMQRDSMMTAISKLRVIVRESGMVRWLYLLSIIHHQVDRAVTAEDLVAPLERLERILSGRIPSRPE